MIYFPLSALIIALTSIFFGLFIYIRGQKNKVNIFYTLFCLSAFIWSFAYFMWQISSTYELAYFYCRVLMVGAIYSSFFYFLTVVYFLNKEKKFKKLIYLFAFFTIVWLVADVYGNLFVTGVESKMFFQFWPTPGILYAPFLVTFFLHVIIASLLLIDAATKMQGLIRQQAKYMLLGLGLAFIGGSTNYFLWYNIPIPPYGNILVVSYIIFTGYAIVRYRFMDIRLIIKRSAVFAFLVLIISAIYSILAYIISIFFTGLIGVQSVFLNGILTAIFVALGFEPLKKWLSKITDKFLFKAEYKPQEVLAEFSERLSSTLDLEKLSQFVVKRLNEVFKTTYVSLFLLNENTKIYEKVSEAGKTVTNVPKIEKKLFENIYGYLKKINREKDIFIKEEIKKFNEQYENSVLDLFYQELDKNGVNVMVPLYIQEKLVGLIFLGDKKSGDVYSQEDIKMLEIISGQSAVAMQNAQLFEEQKHFTEHLKIEVDKATKELKVANIQLKKLDEAKSEFISIASHQLRTPLTVIKGYLSMINQKDFGEVPEKLLNPMDRVYKSTLRIIGLVEDLLNVSRIESGRMKYDFENVDLSALVAEVFDELEQHGKNKGLDFTYQKPTKKIPVLKLDRNKIRETLMNLMDNAIKYTEKGFVKVSLEKLDGHVRFSVSDSGRGIAPDEMPQLFQKFSRAKGVQLVHTEGTGLGLYIAKNILLKHHAKIWAESAGAGKGSTFAIEFKI